MHKVTCSACGQNVEIAPDAALCSVCGENLIGLIPEAPVPQNNDARAYYARAEQFIDENKIERALQVVQEGLEKVITSDLLLLGAILGEKVGQYDLMRHYVSRIPVDDSLRAEGEWLLRAHQARQRAQRQGRDPSQAILEEMSETFGLPPEATYDEPVPANWKAPDKTGGASPQSKIAKVVVPLLVLFGLVGIGWFYRGQLLTQPWVPTALRSAPYVEAVSSDDLQSDPSLGNNETITADPNVNQNEEGPQEAESPSAVLGETTPPAGTSSELATSPTPTIAPDMLRDQLESTSPTDAAEGSPEQTDPNQIESAPNEDAVEDPEELIPDNIAEVATAEPLADADPMTVVDSLSQEPFDVLLFLRDMGRADLASLPLDAQIEDGKLIVTGVVKWYEEREAIIEALQSAPGVNDINAIGLITRTPETYIVQEADTLWIIAFRIFGDGARWPQIYELNQDVLTSPDTLGLGQELKIPPP